MRTLLLFALLFPQFCQGQNVERQILPDAYLLGDSAHAGKTILDYDTRRMADPYEPEIARPPWTLSYNMSNDEYRAFLTRLLSGWREYREECKGDSTKHDRMDERGYVLDMKFGGPDVYEVDTTHVWCVVPKNFMKFDAPDILPRYYWTHRDPTLPGFMDFLKKRIGGGK